MGVVKNLSNYNISILVEEYNADENRKFDHKILRTTNDY
jgi:acylphosphatase